MADLTLPGAGEASAKRDTAAALAQLPSIDRLLSDAALAEVVARLGQPLVKRAAQEELAAQRERLRSDASTLPAAAALCAAIVTRVHRLAASRLPAVFNLTGTVIDTNLGRALLPDEARMRSSARCAGLSRSNTTRQAAAGAIATTWSMGCCAS